MKGNEEMGRRYGRQIAVKEIGKEGQQKISEKRVLVIGCGALGSMVAMQLAGAGVGKIGIADYDKIDLSNLQRQFFFKTEEAGQLKVRVTGERIKGLNPDVAVTEYPLMMTRGKAKEIFRDYDFIIDATDNPESKKMIGEIAREAGKACCIGGVKDFSGQVMTILPEADVFEEFFGNANSEGILPCSLGGVMGPAAALCASVQASETLKYLVNPELVKNHLLVFDMLKNEFKDFEM